MKRFRKLKIAVVITVVAPLASGIIAASVYLLAAIFGGV